MGKQERLDYISNSANRVDTWSKVKRRAFYQALKRMTDGALGSHIIFEEGFTFKETDPLFPYWTAVLRDVAGDIVWHNKYAQEVYPTREEAYAQALADAKHFIERLPCLKERYRESNRECRAKGGIVFVPFPTTVPVPPVPPKPMLNNLQKWKPIETAPKDGTKILVYAQGHITTASWRVRDHFSTRMYWRDIFGGIVEPSYWMPLPEPPSELHRSENDI